MCLHVILIDGCEVLHLSFEQLHCKCGSQLNDGDVTTYLQSSLMASSWLFIFFFW